MSKRKFITLVPLNYNDGSEVPKEIRDQIYEGLFELAGGHYTAGTGQGAFRMKSGNKQVDRCAEVWIWVEEEDVAELKRMVARFADLLGQESMYLESPTTSVEFIEPQSKEAEPWFRHVIQWFRHIIQWARHKKTAQKYNKKGIEA